MNAIREQAERARRAFLKLSQNVDRSSILREVAAAIRSQSSGILLANSRDLESNRTSLSPVLLKRLVLDDSKLRDVVAGVEHIAAMEDPVGRILSETELDEGLVLRKVQTPIGVVAAVFESRPDVVPQISALALRSGNAVLLKGGSEASETNGSIVSVIRSVLESHGLSDAVQLVATREDVRALLEMDDLISLVVPRGSNQMVREIQRSTRIPVLGHAEGICHIYVDEFADARKAIAIAIDAKAQYPAACNSVETILVHARFPAIDQLAQALIYKEVEIRGCPRTQARLIETPGLPILSADESDFGREYSDLIVAMKIVDSLDDAIDHIHRYGSAHTDAIVTEDETNARRFLNEVDSAGVYWNASTRFADGFRYGFGAEVGISTNKTHARGPVGVEGLLIYKYQLTGNGHIVASYTGDHARPFTHQRPGKNHACEPL